MSEQDTSMFNVRRFNSDGTSGMVDTSDLMANKGLTLSFLHVPSGRAVFFKAFITTFNETYNSNWNKEEVFGRADPIVGYKNTQRKISLAFKVPASTHSEAYENLGRVQSLIQFLYPVYTSVQNALTIAESPLLRLKVMNLAVNQSNQDGGDFDDFKLMGSLTGKNAGRGLLGFPSNLTVNHNIQDFDTSVMTLGPGEGLSMGGPPNVLPKMIEINMDFTVIHEHHLGWKVSSTGEGKVFDTEPFPYGIKYRPSVATGLDDMQNAFYAGMAAAGAGSFEEVAGPTETGEPLTEFRFGTSWATERETYGFFNSADDLPDAGTELTPSETPSGDSASDSAGADNEAALGYSFFGIE